MQKEISPIFMITIALLLNNPFPHQASLILVITISPILSVAISEVSVRTVPASTRTSEPFKLISVPVRR
ncbi:hypothetical protein BrE312_3733 [Brenneria sp. EniD312]|nr:hypothetical protein BrE312_3733 [Brenneria sp. EniD312]